MSKVFASGLSEKIRSRYDRFSYFYDFLEAIPEYFGFSKFRRELLDSINGRVLEVGVGTGKNLKYYPAGCEVFAVDFSFKMLERARKKAQERDGVHLLRMDGENLGFKSESFDVIVTSFVLCSIPDPIASLNEIKRLIKKDGQIRMLEHVKSKYRLIAMMEEIHNPFTVYFFGFNVNRDTVNNIKSSGLRILEERNLALKDVFKLIVAKK